MEWLLTLPSSLSLDTVLAISFLRSCTRGGGERISACERMSWEPIDTRNTVSVNILAIVFKGCGPRHCPPRFSAELCVFLMHLHRIAYFIPLLSAKRRGLNCQYWGLTTVPESIALASASLDQAAERPSLRLSVQGITLSPIPLAGSEYMLGPAC